MYCKHTQIGDGNLSTYQQTEFTSIRSNRGHYKERFNWNTLFSIALWPLSKGIVLRSILIITLSFYIWIGINDLWYLCWF